MALTSEMKPCHCLDCGTLFDLATDPLEEKKPVPGSISVCFRCGHIAVFADDLTIRELTAEEMVGIAGNKQILAIQKARKIIRDEMLKE